MSKSFRLWDLDRVKGNHDQVKETERGWFDYASVFFFLT